MAVRVRQATIDLSPEDFIMVQDNSLGSKLQESNSDRAWCRSSSYASSSTPVMERRRERCLRNREKSDCLDQLGYSCSLPRVKERLVSFAEIDEAHRQERARNAAMIREGKATPREVHESNALVHSNASMEIIDLPAYLKRRRLSK